MKKENLIAVKSFDFALQIITLFIALQREKEYVLSKQLLRSGTSIGANIEESEAAQSKKDFIHKMSIASKEARETKYWLRLLKQSNLTRIEVDEHIREIDHIINILTKIIITAKKNMN